jgi:hypothetical protein
MRGLLILLILTTLGCTSDVERLPLAEVDLTDMRVVARLQSQMKPEDRRIFATYILEHRIASAGYCGRPLRGSRGEPPVTIGDALDMTRLRLAEYSAPQNTRVPVNMADDAVSRWAELIARRDLLIDSQTLLRARHGKSVERRSEWKSIQVQMAAVESELLALRPQYLSAVGT